MSTTEVPQSDVYRFDGPHNRQHFTVFRRSDGADMGQIAAVGAIWIAFGGHWAHAVMDREIVGPFATAEEAALALEHIS